jgi:type II secretory pathway component PulC
MRHAFWVLNLGLLILFFILVLLISFYSIRLPRPFPILITEPIDTTIKKYSDAIDLSKIYDNDIFNTYKPKDVRPEKPTHVQPLPTPPEPVSVPAPKKEIPTFLDPLPITLTGIFMFNHDTLNKAIILDNRTKTETTYKVGDEIEDAQLVKIFSNKILLIRSNGQQEMLYLSQDDAKRDTLPQEVKDWSHIVKPIDESHYTVDRQEFVNEVKSLSNFIELFDLSTAYKQGKSIGSKIGQISEQSLAMALGFMPGDIVLRVNDTNTTNTQERIAILNQLATLNDDNHVNIAFLRNGVQCTTTIQLSTIRPMPPIPYFLDPMLKKTTEEPTHTKLQDEQIEAEKLEILKQKEHFAPTIQDLQYHEKERILRHQKEVTEGDQ